VPIDLASLTAEEAPAALSLRQGILNVVYRPGVYTPAFTAAATAEIGPIDADGQPVDRNKAGTDRLCRMVCDLLVSWDLKATPDAEESLPVTMATLASIPLGFIADLMYQLGVAMRPNRQTGPSSVDGSRPAASPAASPNGGGSFAPLDTTAP
jgi:hypothetical protein